MKSTVSALVLASILSISMIAAMPQAQAQTSQIAQIDHRIKVVYTDGSISEFDDYEELHEGSIFAAGKEIQSFRFQVFAAFNYGTSVQVIGASVPHSAAVLTRDGTYKDIPTAGGFSLAKIDNRTYKIYDSVVQASTVESLIGGGSNSFPSEMRATTSPRIDITATIDGMQQTFQSDPTLVIGYFTYGDGEFDNTDGGSGGSDSGDNVPAIPAPTGRVFKKVVLFYEDGGIEIYLNKDLATFSLTAGGQVENAFLKSIEYSLNMWLDDDLYIVPQELSYSSPGATDNFNALLDGEGVNKIGDENIDRVVSHASGGAQYELLSMRVEASDLEPAITTVILDEETSQVRSGELEFLNNAATVKLRDSTGKTYDINIPQQSTVITLSSLKIIEQTPDGEIECDGTECEVEDDQPFEIDPAIVIGIVVAAAASIGGGIALVAKRKK